MERDKAALLVVIGAMRDGTNGSRREQRSGFGGPLLRVSIMSDAVGARDALRQISWPGMSVAVWGLDVTETPAFPEEDRVVRRAVPSRRREFARGRACARKALVGLGGPSAPILPGSFREPIFPVGFVGTITHCEDFVAAAVARDERCRGLGIDAEHAAEVAANVLSMVLTPSEQAGDEGDAYGALVFSAKEAIHKATFPTTRRWLDFQQVEVTLDSRRGTFRAIPASSVDDPPPELSRVEGRYAFSGALVLTLCRLR